MPWMWIGIAAAVGYFVAMRRGGCGCGEQTQTAVAPQTLAVASPEQSARGA